MGPGEALTRFWRERSGRERGVLLAASAIIALSVLYAFLWQPGLAASKRLSVALPALRAQLEDMRAQQKEVQRLRKSLAAASPAADLRAMLAAAAQRSTMGRSVERVEWRSADKVALVATRVDFDDWQQWVLEMQREFGARLDACHVSALEEPGVVRVEATFVAAFRSPRPSP